MHWLPLVAMVIASALPFPHNPATAQPGTDDDPAVALCPQDSRQNHANRDDVKSSAPEHTPMLAGEKQADERTFSSPGFTDRRRGETIRPGSSDRSELLDFPQTDKALGVDTANASPAVKPLQDAQLTRARASPAQDSLAPEAGPDLETLLQGEDMFLDAHPRVLFSPSPSPPERPPLLLMLESGLLDEDGEEPEEHDVHIEGHGDRAMDRGAEHPLRAKRVKRSQLINQRSMEKSVCDAESQWVNDKTSAIDWRGNSVSILQEIQTQTGPLKQYFYETRCRQPEQQNRTKGGGAKPLGTGFAGGSCRGVDKKQWQSECISKHSYVRALTKDANNRIGWRWIRIDSSCVCVLLSRTNQRKEVLTRRGAG